VRQGRFEDAEALLADLDPASAAEAARPRAGIHLAKGELAVAQDILEAALEQTGPGGSDGAASLDLLIEVLLARGQVNEASVQLERLEAVAETSDNGFVRALAAMARGRVCIATGGRDPRSCLRDAVNEFSKAQVPLETARARLELAQVLAEDRPEAALVEARAAVEVFERLNAGRHADAAAALLRTLGVRPSTGRASGDPDGLTRREAEVLTLLGAGLSNPEIAERLYISRKTVEHHVGNVLAKLGLRSRAEAAAFAVQRSGTRNPEPAPD
jgi:DNA-binding NarL/FixJ family response regulator